MRKILLGVFICVFTLSVNGQVSHFKQVSKKPAGAAIPGFDFGIIDGRNALKSTLTGNSPVRSLAFPVLTADHPIVIRRDNSPIYIETKVTPLKSASAVSYEDRLFRFLDENRSITFIKNPRETFKISGIHTDELGITHIRTIQQYRGIEIYGSESAFHMDSEKERYTGTFFHSSREINTIPEIQYAHAIEIVRNDLGKVTVLRDLTSKEKDFLHYNNPECSLMLFDRSDGNYALSWIVSIRPNFIEEWHYVIDAADGSIIRKYNNTKSDGPTTGSAPDLNNISRTFDVYLEAGTYYLINLAAPMYNTATEEGVIMTLNANNTSTSNLDYSLISSNDNAWLTQSAAVSAHYNAFMAYEYFRTKFSRNSINGQGGNIISFVNVADDDGGSMENAFWNGQAVFYGNGGTHFKSLSGANDVAAHELGHGVISNSANLEYIGQSGAINESFADVFGSMVDRDDWVLGEDIVQAAFYPSGALRNMSDPHNGGSQGNIYWQPAHLSEMYLGDQDNGGVHINSGIGNRAYYLFATAVTKDKAERVYYRALTEYLTKTSQFIDLRIAVIQAAKDLYGANSTEATKAAEAFNTVGIYQDEPVEEPDDYNTNPGQEHLLIYNTDEAFTPTLYKSPASGNTYEPLSSTVMKGKVSVTDDGSAAVFVDMLNRINVLGLNPDDPFEDLLSDEEFFDNAAVSKDGNRIAAVSVEEDAAIYVYDFETQVLQQFNLYNPTTSDDNINSGGVLFADAIEFDHTGEYLIYDAYNELSSSSSQNISYWDVGFIRVWDNQDNTFGDGSIQKLFTQLPENVSVGNPVFSKNSPNIIAFDYYYYDGVDEEFAIYGANLETGDLELITNNTTLGYPSYSKNDAKIAFTVAASASQDDIYTIEIAADKISPAGSPVFLVEYAKWPVYYAIGDRELGLAPVANFTADYKTGGAPLQVKFVDLSTNNPTTWSWAFQGGTPATSAVQNPEVIYNNSGTFRVTLTASNMTGDNTVDRQGYIVVSELTSVENPENRALMFFPNPVDDVVQFVYNGKFSVRIFNQSGKLLLTQSNQLQMDLSHFSSGLYIMEIETDSGTSRHKLLKQ